MIGLGNWGKNIYRNLEELNVLEKIYVLMNDMIENNNKSFDDLGATAIQGSANLKT